MILIVRRIVSILLLVLSAGVLIWAFWPDQRLVYEQVILPDEMRLLTDPPGTNSALMEVRQVNLEWPSTLHTGDQAEIDIVFKLSNAEILAPQPSENYIDVYQDYNLMAESRLEVAGLRVNPPNPRRESLLSGQSLKFSWQVSAEKAASYPAKTWLLLRFLPLQGGNASEIPIFVHQMNIRATSLLGMNAPTARVVGGIAMIAGLALGYDVMIGIIRWRRRNKTHR